MLARIYQVVGSAFQNHTSLHKMGDQANTIALEMVEKLAVIEPTVVHDEGQGLEDVDALR